MIPYHILLKNTTFGIRRQQQSLQGVRRNPYRNP